MYCLKDIEEYTQQALGKNARDYYSSGADGQQTLRDNIESFSR